MATRYVTVTTDALTGEVTFSGVALGVVAAPFATTLYPSGATKMIVFDGPDSGVDTSLDNGRTYRPKVGVIWFGDGDEVPGKVHWHGAVNVFEINDSPEVIGRRSPGQFVDGGTVAATTLAVAIANINVAATITVANAFNGSVTFPDTGKLMLRDATGAGVAKVAYTSVTRSTGVFSGLTVEWASQTAWDIGDDVYGVIVENTNLLLMYGQADMGGDSGFQDRSAQLSMFTAEDHLPDGFGGFFSAGYLQFTTSSPGPNSQRRTQMTLDEKGFLALHGSGFLDRSSILTTSARFTVAPKNTRLNGSIALPAANIPVLDPSGFPTAGSFNVTSDAGSQTVAYTGYSIDTATGKWRFTGCTGGTGTAADQAFVQLPKTTVTTGIGTMRCNIVAQNDGTNDTVTIGKIGPTSADPEAGIKLGGSSGAVEIYRGASGEAWTADIFRFIASGATPAIKIHVSGEAEARLSFRVGGVMWGPGGSTAVDTSLRRVDVAGLAVRDAGDTADGNLRMANCRVTGALDHEGSTAGFFNTTPVTKETGVAVTAAGIHAALVRLGLIGA